MGRGVKCADCWRHLVPREVGMSQSDASVVRSGGLFQGFGGGHPVNSVLTAGEMSRICDVPRLA